MPEAEMTRLTYSLSRTVLASIAALGAASLAACAADDAGSAIVILSNQVPDQGDNGCVIPVGESGEFRQAGQIDVSATDFNSGAFYEVYPAVESRLEPTDGELQRTISVRGADIQLLDADGGVIDEFSRLFSGSIRPGAQATFVVRVIDADQLDGLGLSEGQVETIVARFTIFGDLAGDEVETAEFDYPIDVCNGCLIADLGSCEEVPSNFASRTGGECNAFQDSPLDCCTLNGTQVCPAVGLGASL
jgi:hypothetical protein